MRRDTHRLALLVAAAFILELIAHGANAASLISAAGARAPKEIAADSSFMHATHGCHYSCECGPLKDFGCDRVYHRHLHMLCLPVRCRGKNCDPTPPEGVCSHIFRLGR
jgi:hypothetical protein